MRQRSAEILCIGTEILMGDIVNTNAAYIAKELAGLGINVYHQSVVGDNPQRLREALELAFSRADIVITTGISGLYPQGIPVGKVKGVANDETDSSLYAMVEPYVDIKNVRDVFVITEFQGQGNMVILDEDGDSSSSASSDNSGEPDSSSSDTSSPDDTVSSETSSAAEE